MGKIKRIDIREMGSGNAGGTNALRTMGATFALGVLLIDVLKGFIDRLKGIKKDLNEINPVDMVMLRMWIIQK